MTDSARIQVLHTIEQHLQMNRQERRRAGIRTPRRIIEATRDELVGTGPWYVGSEHSMMSREPEH